LTAYKLTSTLITVTIGLFMVIIPLQDYLCLLMTLT
jgi:hypothetical protein